MTNEEHTDQPDEEADTEGHAGKFRFVSDDPDAPDTEGHINWKGVSGESGLESDTEGHGMKFRGFTDGPDDTEGHTPRINVPESDTEGDTEGHKRKIRF